MVTYCREYACINQDGKSNSVKQNKLGKSANFVSKFKAKHAVEEQSQCLEESQHCFESKDLDLLT